MTFGNTLRIGMAGTGLAAVLAVSACASKPVLPIGTLDNETLCYRSASGSWMGNDDDYRAEIDKRGLIGPGEWALMQAHEFRVGMSECAALAVMRSSRGTYKATTGRYYRFGSDNTVVVTAPDPRAPNADVVNDQAKRMATVCFGALHCQVTTYDVIEQKYVPKYKLTFQGGKLADCKAVDLAHLTSPDPATAPFTLPCAKDVPGF